MMFTYVQGQELINNTIHEWTTINGVNGYMFTSKTNTSKYIFLPAGGLWYDTVHNVVGLYGYYWSATYRSLSGAWCMSTSSSHITLGDASTNDGLPIRPVRQL